MLTTHCNCNYILYMYNSLNYYKIIFQYGIIAHHYTLLYILATTVLCTRISITVAQVIFYQGWEYYDGGDYPCPWVGPLNYKLYKSPPIPRGISE